MSSETNHAIQHIYKVDIDFDEAEKAWRENKKYIGNGMFKYICKGITKKGNKCNNKPTDSGYCHLHSYK